MTEYTAPVMMALSTALLLSVIYWLKKRLHKEVVKNDALLNEVFDLRAGLKKQHARAEEAIAANQINLSKTDDLNQRCQELQSRIKGETPKRVLFDKQVKGQELTEREKQQLKRIG